MILINIKDVIYTLAAAWVELPWEALPPREEGTENDGSANDVDQEIQNFQEIPAGEPNEDTYILEWLNANDPLHGVKGRFSEVLLY